MLRNPELNDFIPLGWGNICHYGYDRRKNIPALPLFIGKEIWFVRVEFGTTTQFVPNPAVDELVCICRLQPR